MSGRFRVFHDRQWRAPWSLLIGFPSLGAHRREQRSSHPARGRCRRRGDPTPRSVTHLEEVRELAAAMSVKEALHYDPTGRYLPMGGAKGGIDCDPLSSEARGVLSRFLAFIRP
ncbi:Glu/Leu/Phe/Val dehydrogenase dimerization domain-containing protein [Streptomyces sp. NPDC054813]